ncbi:hypothetical protein KJ815_12205, partial [bacterium]|nr:hypothetical protein [bacterium]
GKVNAAGLISRVPRHAMHPRIARAVGERRDAAAEQIERLQPKWRRLLYINGRDSWDSADPSR